MDNREFLYEDWSDPFDANSLNEETGTTPIKLRQIQIDDQGKGKLYLTGIFLQAEKVNNNGRIYPKPIMANAVNNYIKYVINNGQGLGETTHPKASKADPNYASILTVKLWWVGNDVWGKAVIIEGDYGPGDKLAANIRAGWVPGLSSRGLGSTRKDPRTGYVIVQDDYVITVAADVVQGPSGPNAFATSVIRESDDSKPETSQINEDSGPEQKSNGNSDDCVFNKIAENFKKLSL